MFFCAEEEILKCTNLADPVCSQAKDEYLFAHPHVVDWWTLHHIFFPFVFVLHGVKWEHALILVYIWKAQECAFSEFANIKDALLVDPLEAVMGIMTAHIIVAHYGVVEKTVRDKLWYIAVAFVLGYGGTELVWHRTILADSVPDELLFLWPTGSIMLIGTLTLTARRELWVAANSYVAFLYGITFLSARRWYCGRNTTLNTFHLQICAHAVLLACFVFGKYFDWIREHILIFRKQPSSPRSLGEYSEKAPKYPGASLIPTVEIRMYRG